MYSSSSGAIGEISSSQSMGAASVLPPASSADSCCSIESILLDLAQSRPHEQGFHVLQTAAGVRAGSARFFDSITLQFAV